MIGKLFILGLLVLAIAYFYGNGDGRNKQRRSSDEPVKIVKTSYGRLQGSIGWSRDDREFYEWLGIPYAQSPVGELRFQSPKLAVQWSGVRQATEYGNECPQLDMFWEQPVGHEDCLSLNIFSPKATFDSDKLVPVLFWIHGGYFNTGSSKVYDPSYFMDEDIVVVTINYRLGALGFLNTADPQGLVRGNMGLKDQALALKWVKSEILKFGGDPERISVMGESAGAASAHYQMLSPMSKDLMASVVAQSGSALNVWALYENPKEQSQELGKRVSCPTKNVKEMVDCLREVEVTKILGSFRPGMANLLSAFAKKSQIFVPTIETKVDQETFLSEHPLKIIKSKKFTNVPLLIGFNSEEGLMGTFRFLKNETLRDYINKNWMELAESLLQFSESERLTHAQKVRDFYFPLDKNDGQIDLASFNSLTDVVSDRFFKYQVTKAAQQHASQGTRVYSYFYKKSGPTVVNLLKDFQGSFPKIVVNLMTSWFKTKVLGIQPEYFGVAHADELAMLFHMRKLFRIDVDDPHYQFSKDFVKLWVNFASDPSDIKFRATYFPPLSSKAGSKIKYFEIDDSASFKEASEKLEKSFQFWNSILLDS